ncbi:hypothetical protein SUFG_00060 [Sulfitobacter phage phiCB2047-B]|uniref:Uncharacterized protein n=1 Tax=Sulfitobacter phage phiCB2047-B TaxID=754046 RepID=M4PMU7_9CAUD|nr:hypothetical protein SUFG_00060 [Sulfitobacter phage phiCB2047-B]AGH07427.1 hypothetical protein SUFG_00060 [Sulfitobacter phage phiCB2047-B]
MIKHDQLTDAEVEEEFLPHWARCAVFGDYTHPNASLPTRDGRVTGNAVMIGMADKQLGYLTTYLIVTDAGHIIRPNKNELKEMFHPPKWSMEKLLPAHTRALEELG